MKQFLYATILLFCISSCASVKPYNAAIEEEHSIEDLHEDVDYAYAKLKKHHPQLYFYTPKEELDVAFQSVKENINQPMTSMEFYQELAPAIAQVRQGHLFLRPPHKKRSKKELKQFNKEYKKMNFSAYTFESFADGIYLTDVRNEDSTLLHSRLLAIDDLAVDEIIEEQDPFFTSDGYNETFLPKYYGYRIMSLYGLKQGRYDSLELTFQQQDSVFTKKYQLEKKVSTPKIDSTENQTLTKKERKAKRKQEREDAPKLTKMERKEKRQAEKEKYRKNDREGLNKASKLRSRELTILDSVEKTALLTVRTFTRGPFAKFYDHSFSKIDSAGIENLIIDLRYNGGGRVAEIHCLASYLMDEEFQLLEPIEVNSRQLFLKTVTKPNQTFAGRVATGLFSPIIAGYGLLKTKTVGGKKYYTPKSTKPTEPKENAFTGNVYILINGYSFSASSVISSFLDGEDRATFVGEETGGAYNGTVAVTYKQVDLPNSKIRLPIGLGMVQTPFRDEPHGYGVKPDVEITPTFQDRLNGVDPELNYVIELIKGSRN